jgi:TolB-like protein/DNA-binding winged helix-turn-helix (wHTH) protein/Tfp pilus assembly protein PilF
MSNEQQHLCGFGPFTLDLTDRFLLRDGQPVPLPPKTLETLIVLVQHQGRLVTKDELMKTLWPDSFVEETNLNHHVWTLRKALGESAGGDRYIETVPRRGYRFVADVTELPLGSDELVVEKHSFTHIFTEEAEVIDTGLPGDNSADGQAVALKGQEQQKRHTGALNTVRALSKNKLTVAATAISVLMLAGIGVGYWFAFGGSADSAQIESIAVLPFVNESGNPEVEYLSDGMTESLINSLSRLPKLSVKARSSVFRYKGKEVEPQRIGAELAVEAILNGRVVQQGDELTLYLSLVDTKNGNQLWGEQYNRKLGDLVSLQGEIAHDVSSKLRARLSGADEKNLAKNFTENTEAYQLYLKGRYHTAKLKRSETQKAVSYFQQAIALDPAYALAYVGLAEANRALTLSGEMPSNEYMPKAKAAAQKAVEIDESLAEAHSALGMIIMWYDRDWKEAEKQSQRALELNPNSSDAHLVYAHLLSIIGKHVEALTEAKRARELDPVNLRTNALEAEFLINAGQPDEALARCQKIFELDPNFWFAHVWASSAYVDKGMFAEAVAEARKARELSPTTSHPYSFLGYALAKSGKRAEARALLEELLKLSAERYVPPYYVAMIYYGLDQREEAIAWLERGYEQRDLRMVFLKVERKWDNLRNDPRFQDLSRRVGLP